MTVPDVISARARVADQVKIDLFSATQDNDVDAQRKSISRTFTTDTVTVPTKEMYEYSVRSSVGDDVYDEPTTKALEVHMAKLTGKEAALFMPSGTMSNQIALRTHLKQPPYSILCDIRAHINKYEAGGAAFHSGAPMIAVAPSNDHHLTLSDVKDNIVIGADIHIAPTEVVALENTLNGTIIPQDEVVAISEYVHSLGIQMHMDGARIWHVAAETGLSIKTLCDPFDSVSLCFSKGLGAPIGSCLVGPKDYITKARWFRKLFGGGMRQTGFMAAAAAYALTYNFPLLTSVHTLAKTLEDGLIALGCDILSPAETCMLFYDPSPLGLDYADIAERGSQLPEPLKLGGSRLVVHIQTTPAAVNDFLQLIKVLAEEKKKEGFVPVKREKKKLNGCSDVYFRLVKK